MDGNKKENNHILAHSPNDKNSVDRLKNNIKIFGGWEIFVGISGTLSFILGVCAWFYAVLHPNTPDIEFARQLGQLLSLLSFPLVIILISGIALLRFSRFSIIAHTLLVPLSFLCSVIIIFTFLINFSKAVLVLRIIHALKWLGMVMICNPLILIIVLFFIFQIGYGIKLFLNKEIRELFNK